MAATGLRHVIRVARSVVRESVKRNTRSPKWRAVEKAHLAAHPTCGACGGTTRIQVHHKRPFNEDPALELDPDNLITLCMEANECHVQIGHGDSFHYYNPGVVEDAAEALQFPDHRQAIEVRAKSNRLLNEPGA